MTCRRESLSATFAILTVLLSGCGSDSDDPGASGGTMSGPGSYTVGTVSADVGEDGSIQLSHDGRTLAGVAGIAPIARRFSQTSNGLFGIVEFSRENTEEIPFSLDGGPGMRALHGSRSMAAHDSSFRYSMGQHLSM